MKVLRVIGNIIIGIILFGLIFTCLFIIKTKNLLEGDVLRETIKTAIEDVEKNDNHLTESQKQVVDDMFKDGDASSMIQLVLDNYKEFKNNSNYSVSHEDAKKLFDFVNKYRNHLIEISGENVSQMTEEEFEEYFNNNKIDEFAKNAFNEFDKNLNSDTINKALDAYSIATSKTVILILIFVIALFIGLLLLINWSLIKWMLVVGIDLIITGSLFFVLYIAAEAVKESLLNEKAKINFNFDSFLISSIVQVVIGILLIVLYVVLKHVFKKNKPNQINNQNVQIPQNSETNANQTNQSAAN